MKKNKLMQEFKNLEIENASSVYGGQGDYLRDSYCDRECQYTTAGSQATTDKKTDRVVDEFELVIEADGTYVAPYQPIIKP